MSRTRVSTTLVAVWVIAAVVGRLADGSHPLIAALAVDGSAAGAAGLAALGAWRHRGRVRKAWLWVAAALSVWAVGDVVWSILRLNDGTRPAASVADLLALAGYPLLALGLVQMVRLRTLDHSRDGLLDGLAVAIAAGLALWQYLVAPAVDGVHGFTRLVEAAYPMMDVMALMGLAWLAFAPGRRGTPTHLLFVGLLSLLALDLATIIGPWQQYTPAHYPPAYLLFALAALHPDSDELTDRSMSSFQPLHLVRVAFLGVALLTPPTINLIEHAKGDEIAEPTLVFTTLLVAGIVFARLAGLVRDREHDQQELTHQASHDALTGLLNRYLLADRIEHALTRAARRDAALAVLYLDLDRFKAVNDTLGHQAGDTLLIEAAARVNDAVRTGDTVARLGGDEFAVLCEDLITPSVAFEIAQRIVDALSKPFTIGDSAVVVSASVGVAVHQTSDDTAESILRDADAAMYRAKEQGRHRWEVFDADMRAWVDRRRETEKALQTAVKHGELRLHYQPIVRVTTGEIVGFEALVRWQRPGIGLVAPSEFVSLAEETGLIVPIGEWVMEQACFQLAHWRSEHPEMRALHVAVNVSGRQLTQANLCESVQRAITRARVSPGDVLLELTESMLLDDAEWSIRQLEAIKRLGVRVAIDDFGTGYSALAYLRQFPIDVVKIDRLFMHDVASEAPAATVVAAVVALSHALGLEVIGEGAESVEQVAALRRLGCDFAQGFYYSRPLAAAEVDELLASVSRPFGSLNPVPTASELPVTPRTAVASGGSRWLVRP